MSPFPTNFLDLSPSANIAKSRLRIDNCYSVRVTTTLKAYAAQHFIKQHQRPIIFWNRLKRWVWKSFTFLPFNYILKLYHQGDSEMLSLQEKNPVFHAKSRQWIIILRSICKDFEINFPTVESQKCIFVVTWDRSSKNSRQIPYLKIVYSLSGCLGYHAPMDLFIELNHMSSKLEEPLPQGKQINLCVGKEWYRFPSSFFLPSER